MAKIERKNRDARMDVVFMVGDNSVLMPYCDDLEDEEIQEHATRAIRNEDWEYLQALAATAKSRNFYLLIDI